MTNKERDFKGIWIPKSIWLNTELSIMERVFLSEIDSLDNSDGCFASNSYFAEFFGVSKSRCTQIISSLKDRGFITVDLIMKGKQVKQRVIRVVNILWEGGKYPARGCLENCEDSNTVDNKVEKRKSIKNNSYSPEFEEMWKCYDRKGTKLGSWMEWQKLEHNDHTAALNSLEFYFMEQPTKQYRKDLERYLKKRVFESVMERAENKCLNLPEAKGRPTSSAPAPRNIAYNPEDFIEDANGNWTLKPEAEQRRNQSDDLFGGM